MNRLIIFCSLVLSASCFAQQNDKTVAIESRQDGDSVSVIIRTTANGILTEEIYSGKAAVQKLKEFNQQVKDSSNDELGKEGSAKGASKSVEVQFREIQGVKTLEIKETINGKTTTRIYQGEEAGNKLKELQENASLGPKKSEKQMR